AGRVARPGQTGAAVAASRGGPAAPPPDAGVRRDRGAARRAAPPAITPLVGGSHDSDGNTTLRFGATAELRASGPTRLGVRATREQVRDEVTTIGLDELTLRAAARPTGTLQIDAEGGATRVDA